jgi:hypothetical protein
LVRFRGQPRLTVREHRVPAAAFGALAASLALGPSPAHACGVSATGVASCSLAEHREATRSRFAAGVGGVYTSTVLRFDDLRAEQERAAAFAELAYFPTSSLALQAGAGALLGGSLRAGGASHDFLPGPMASLGARWLVLAEPAYFAALTAGFSFVLARTRRESEPSEPYHAYDLRLGAEAGLHLARILRPYVLARVFGGPVVWRYRGETVTGTDVYHYQVGAGLGVALGRHVTLLVEGSPLGEQAASVGVGVSF